MIKAAFFDIDGTLYSNSQSRVLPSTMDALHQLREKGVMLFVCTNRSLDEIEALPEELKNLLTGVVSLAGSKLSVNGKSVLVPVMKQDEVDRVIELMDKHQIMYRWVTEGQGGHLNCDDENTIQLFEKAYGMHPTPQTYMGEPLSHLLYYSQDEAFFEELHKLAPSMEHLHLGFANEMLVKGASKGNGMKQMMEYFGLTVEDCAAFDDGYNDADMLEMAKFGIAMGNAKDNCKQAADYVTDHIDQDGLYKACLHFGWIERKCYEN